jgi:hypothetical protein
MAHRIKAQLRSGELAVPGDMWPIFLYADSRYDSDNPWDGLLRNALLVKVQVAVYQSIPSLFQVP